MHPFDAQQLALGLIQEHGLVGWRFRFDHAKRRFGCCRSSEKTITLSRPLTILNSQAQVRDTILHEIAHALTPGEGHGVKWRAKCREIGADPKRCYDDDEVVSPTRKVAAYRMGCRKCDWWVERRRISRRRYICTRCRSRLVTEERGAGCTSGARMG